MRVVRPAEVCTASGGIIFLSRSRRAFLLSTICASRLSSKCHLSLCACTVAHPRVLHRCLCQRAIAEAYQQLQFVERPPAGKGCPGQRHAVRDRLCSPSDINARCSVEQNNVSLGFAAAILQNIPQDARVLCGVPTLQFVPVSPRYPEILRNHKLRLERPVPQLGNLGSGLQYSSRPNPLLLKDQSLFAMQLAQRFGKLLGQREGEHTDNLSPRARRIQQRSEEIENGTNTQLPAHSAHCLHRRVKQRREQKRDAAFCQAILKHVQGCFEVDAKVAQDIRAAALPRHGAISVFGYRYPGPRDHKGGSRGNIECSGSIASGSSRIDQSLLVVFQATAKRLIPRANPTISSTVSPLAAKALSNAAIWISLSC